MPSISFSIPTALTVVGAVTLQSTTSAMLRTDAGGLVSTTTLQSNFSLSGGGTLSLSTALSSINSVTSVAGQNLSLIVGSGGTALTLANSTLDATFGSTTPSTSTTTGAIVAQSIGIVGAGWFGGNITVTGTLRGIKFNDGSSDAYWLHFASVSTSFPMRLALASDPISTRAFQVGYYDDDSSANTWHSKLIVNGYTGDVTISGTIISNAGIGYGVTSTATSGSTTTLTSTSTVVQIFTGSSTQVCQLPAANIYGPNVAVVYVIKNRSSSNVTISSAGSDTIDGAASFVLSGGNNQSITLMSNGSTAWEIT